MLGQESENRRILCHEVKGSVLSNKTCVLFYFVAKFQVVANFKSVTNQEIGSELFLLDAYHLRFSLIVFLANRNASIESTRRVNDRRVFKPVKTD